MLQRHLILLRTIIPLLLGLLPVFAQAHSNPSLTMEAVFELDHSFTLRVNLDPRLILSTQPATLPPVEAQWYREQSATQLKDTEAKALEYVTKALGIRFSGTDVPLPVVTFTPIDGGTNVPLGPETQEVHLLAEMRGQVPSGATTFQVVLGPTASASMILINSLGGQSQRRPSVVFPGETSRVFSLVPVVTTPLSQEAQVGPGKAWLSPWSLGFFGVLLVGAAYGMWRVAKSKRARS